MNLLDIIKQRHLTEAWTDAPACPKCDSTTVKVTERMVTLVGGPNHHWDTCECRSCSFSFVREYKDGDSWNVWYTKDGHALKGVSSCFERYTYNCSKCDGIVKRSHRELDSDKAVTCLMFANGRRMYRTLYLCEACGHGGEANDHF